jgi:hypothetical protein
MSRDETAPLELCLDWIEGETRQSGRLCGLVEPHPISDSLFTLYQLTFRGFRIQLIEFLLNPAVGQQRKA